MFIKGLFYCAIVSIVDCQLYNFNEKKQPLSTNKIELITGSLNIFLKNFDFVMKEPPDYNSQISAVYDFIIVGAGSAGSVLASRLSENPSHRVLLIEAGRGENLMMDIPIFANNFQDSDINWDYRTEPSDKYCLAMVNNQCRWPRGKVMGGSSVLNYMIATRGNRRDYDRWAALGNEGWSYDQVLPYFKKLEGFDDPQARDNPYYGDGTGLLHTTYVKYQTPLARAFLEAHEELGYPIVDYDGHNQTGFSRLKTTTKRGFRFSNSQAYLHPASERKNLLVTKNSLARRVLIHPVTKRAHGVEFLKSGKKVQVFASKEVILSAGAIGSPQLLMLSGIGPERHLRSIGISPVQNLPVGENLMDHIAFGGMVFTINQTVSLVSKELLNVLNPFNPSLRYAVDQTGPMTIPGGCESVAFIDLEGKDFPEVELLFVSGSIFSDPILKKNLGLSEQFWNSNYRHKSNMHSWTIFPMLMRPKSRGRLLLRDKYISSKPKLVANYMDHPEDVRVLIEGIRLAIKVGNTEAMKRYGSKLYCKPLAGCENHIFDSDDYWECALRHFTFTIYHYSGTCKMGPQSDPGAVVNPRLQVPKTFLLPLIS